MRRVLIALLAATLVALVAIIGLLSRRQSDLSAQPTQTRQATEVSLYQPPGATATVAGGMAGPMVSAPVSVLPTPAPAPTLPSPTADLPAGPLAPDFTLHSAQGTAVTLSTYQGKSNVVLVFYRGQT